MDDGNDDRKKAENKNLKQEPYKIGLSNKYAAQQTNQRQNIEKFNSLKEQFSLLKDQFKSYEDERIKKYVEVAKETEPQNTNLARAVDSLHDYQEEIVELTLDDAINLKNGTGSSISETLQPLNEKKTYKIARNFHGDNPKPDFNNDNVMLQSQYYSLELEQKNEFRSILNYLDNLQLVKTLAKQYDESLIELYRTYDLLVYVESNGQNFPSLVSRHNVKLFIEAQLYTRKLKVNDVAQDLIVESLIEFNVNDDVDPALVTIKYHPALQEPMTIAFNELQPIANNNQHEIKLYLDSVIDITQQLAQRVINQLVSSRKDIIKALRCYCIDKDITTVDFTSLSVLQEPTLYQIASAINNVNKIKHEKPEHQIDKISAVDNLEPEIFDKKEASEFDNYAELSTPEARISFRMKLNKLAEMNMISELGTYLQAQSKLSLLKAHQQYALISTIAVVDSYIPAIDYRLIVKKAIEHQLDERGIKYDSEKHLLNLMVEITFLEQENSSTGQICFHPILHDVMHEQFRYKLVSNYQGDRAANSIYFDLDLTMDHGEEIMSDILSALEENTDALLDKLQEYCIKNEMKAKFDKSLNYSLYDIAKAVYKVESMIN